MKSVCWKDVFIIILIILLIISYTIHFVNVLVKKKMAHFHNEHFTDSDTNINYRDLNIKDKLEKYTTLYGEPNKLEFSAEHFEGATWNFNNDFPSEFIKIDGNPDYNNERFITIGKNMNIPEHLEGILSFTNNIQINKMDNLLIVTSNDEKTIENIFNFIQNTITDYPDPLNIPCKEELREKYNNFNF
tara:strand:- start:10674 stop:11237 length:564 start_codon:yes stop_codon:yes gene_type:complete